MNKLKLASISLLLAGATAMPVMAQRAGGEPSREGGRESAQSDQGRDRQGDRGSNRGEDRRGGDERRDDRGSRGPAPGEPGNLSGPQGGYARGGQAQRGPDRRSDDNRYGDRNTARYDDRRGRNDDRYDGRRDGRYDGRHDDRRYDSRYDNRGGRNDRYVRPSDRRWNGYNWYPQYRYRAPVRYVYPRDYRPYRWSVGHRLPSSYYGRNYYVDYRAYDLPPPPYGYSWVRVDRDVVLVALASGLIRDVLYGLYY